MDASWVAAAPSDAKIGAGPPAGRGARFGRDVHGGCPLHVARGRRPAAASRLPKRRLRKQPAQAPHSRLRWRMGGLMPPSPVASLPLAGGLLRTVRAVHSHREIASPLGTGPQGFPFLRWRGFQPRCARARRLRGGRHGRGRRAWRRRSPLQEWSQPHAQAGAGGRCGESPGQAERRCHAIPCRHRSALGIDRLPSRRHFAMQTDGRGSLRAVRAPRRCTQSGQFQRCPAGQGQEKPRKMTPVHAERHASLAGCRRERCRRDRQAPRRWQCCASTCAERGSAAVPPPTRSWAVTCCPNSPAAQRDSLSSTRRSSWNASSMERRWRSAPANGSRLPIGRSTSLPAYPASRR